MKTEFWIRVNWKELKSSRLRAFTVVESIVGMILIVLSFAAAMMIFMQIITGNRIEAKTKANIILAKTLDDIKTNQFFLDGDMEVDGIRIEKRINNYPQVQNAILIHLKAISPTDQKITEIKEILYMPPQ